MKNKNQNKTELKQKQWHRIFEIALLLLSCTCTTTLKESDPLKLYIQVWQSSVKSKYQVKLKLLQRGQGSGISQKYRASTK